MTIFSRTAATVARYEFGRPAFGVAATYAALVAGTAAVVTAVYLFSDDPGFIGVWLVMASAPTSALVLQLDLAALPGPWTRISFEVLCLAAGLFQTWAIWLILRGRRVRSSSEV